MAIAEVAEYAHLSGVDIEALAAELEAIRVDIEDSRGAMRYAQVARDERITKPRIPPAAVVARFSLCDNRCGRFIAPA
jgi:hypothetical protein